LTDAAADKHRLGGRRRRRVLLGCAVGCSGRSSWATAIVPRCGGALWPRLCAHGQCGPRCAAVGHGNARCGCAHDGLLLAGGRWCGR
jgi:hypothetical protein